MAGAQGAVSTPRPPLLLPAGSSARLVNAMSSHAPPAKPWSQVSVAPCTQTPLQDALPSAPLRVCRRFLQVSAMAWVDLCSRHDPTAVAYLLPRVASSMASSAPLQIAATWQACTAPYGQHYDRSNSPTISSFGVRSIWCRFASFMSQGSSIVQETSSHASPPFRENGDSFPRRFGDAQVDHLGHVPTASCLIPLRRDLLSQRGGTLWHPRPDLWNLYVWSLDGMQMF